MINLGFGEDAFDNTGVLDSTGGFIWWYFDLVDSNGNAIILIWSFGLPFIPKKPGRPADTLTRNQPSVCVAVYKNYRQFFYLLQEYPADSAICREGYREITIGRNTFKTSINETRVSFSAKIETPVPGSHHTLIGSLSAEGRVLRGPRDTYTLPEHTWSPVFAHSEGDGRLLLGPEQIINLQGRAYFDCNSSAVPLDQLGIDLWRWMRIAFPTRELIFYEVEPRQSTQESKQILLTIDSDGQIKRGKPRDITWSNSRLSTYGLPYYRDLLLGDNQSKPIHLRFRPPVDTGPFYLRFLVDAVDEASGEKGYGVAELVKPGRIDLAPIPFFVRMRIHRITGPNSPFLPLFSGSNSHRLSRLVAHLRTLSFTRGGQS
jgi:carotenoid 1,2-hydratase